MKKSEIDPSQDFGTNHICLKQCSNKSLKTQFHNFSMIFHDQQCNYHDYLMHGFQPPLLVTSLPR